MKTLFYQLNWYAWKIFLFQGRGGFALCPFPCGAFPGCCSFSIAVASQYPHEGFLPWLQDHKASCVPHIACVEMFSPKTKLLSRKSIKKNVGFAPGRKVCSKSRNKHFSLFREKSSYFLHVPRGMLQAWNLPVEPAMQPLLLILPQSWF